MVCWQGNPDPHTCLSLLRVGALEPFSGSRHAGQGSGIHTSFSSPPNWFTFSATYSSVHWLMEYSIWYSPTWFSLTDKKMDKQFLQVSSVRRTPMPWAVVVVLSSRLPVMSTLSGIDSRQHLIPSFVSRRRIKKGCQDKSGRNCGKQVGILEGHSHGNPESL